MSSADPYINMIIALLGLAYPILLQVIARLDEKYESDNIATLFKTEWEWKAFRYTLITSLFSVFIWSLKCEPMINIKGFNFIIENSATIMVAFNAILLVVSFFYFVSKVIKYYTPYSLIPYLIACHENSDSEVKFFPALSDLLLLSIKKQQTNLSKTLSDFFYTAFRKVRSKFPNEPTIYPDYYYETVYKAIEELAIIKEKRNYLLEHRTSGGIWLLGEEQGKEISDNTYTWIWRNLILAERYKQDDLIVNHWETFHQYYAFNLPLIQEKYEFIESDFQVNNQVAVDKRIEEREKVIEFHYALGGLLTYRMRYKCLKRLFNHTQSQPPKYELLPETMVEIFKFYFDVKDPFERKYVWISHQYPFPELSGLNADKVIKKFIMSYMAVLFLRQYSLFPYHVAMQPIDFPPTPNTQGEIKKWIDGLDYFKKLVEEHLLNEELLKCLNLDFITQDWCDQNQKLYPVVFIENFKANLEVDYERNALDLPLSDEKISQFKISTKGIIELAVEKLQSINNADPLNEDFSDKWYIKGQKMLQSKDAFFEDPEVHYLNYDSILGSLISRRLNEGVGEIFLHKMSQSYLVKPEDFFKAIDKLGIDKSYVIVNFRVNLDYYINDIRVALLSKEKYKDINIYSLEGSHLVKTSFFILKRSDLPNISSKPVTNDIISKYSLEKISESINLYASIIDLNNTSNDIYNENSEDKSEDEIRKSVLLNVYFAMEFEWKRNIDVIQLKQHSEFLQKGIANKLDDIKPLSKKP